MSRARMLFRYHFLGLAITCPLFLTRESSICEVTRFVSGFWKIRFQLSGEFEMYSYPRAGNQIYMCVCMHACVCVRACVCVCVCLMHLGRQVASGVSAHGLGSLS